MGQGVGLPASPTGSSGTETTGSPEFPADPLDTCPAHIRPRRDRSARPFSARGVAFRSRHGVGSHNSAFGAQSHGLHRRCLRFAAPVTRETTQDSLPGGGQPYPRGLRPAGSVRKVSETTHLTSSLPPSPSFARRTPGTFFEDRESPDRRSSRWSRSWLQECGQLSI